eukprot:m.214686 g.214686  ORF g.214686 m.214686 type:complete len:62 (+) comp15871_c0_seq6:408-593(+)
MGSEDIELVTQSDQIMTLVIYRWDDPAEGPHIGQLHDVQLAVTEYPLLFISRIISLICDSG